MRSPGVRIHHPQGFGGEAVKPPAIDQFLICETVRSALEAKNEEARIPHPTDVQAPPNTVIDIDSMLASPC
jgi:hypothetical protein